MFQRKLANTHPEDSYPVFLTQNNPPTAPAAAAATAPAPNSDPANLICDAAPGKFDGVGDPVPVALAGAVTPVKKPEPVPVGAGTPVIEAGGVAAASPTSSS